VRFAFTLCGGHISPILTASSVRGIRVVDVRDEATAVFAADAVARLTGTPGVAAVTAGPGLTNTLTALQNALVAQSPVILLTGAVPTALEGRGALQDIEQEPVAAPHVKQVMRVRRVRDLGPAIHEAFALASSGVPGPVMVECPVDVLYDESTVRHWYAQAAGNGASLPERMLRLYLKRHVDRIFAPNRSAETGVPTACVPVASSSSLDATVQALRAAARPLMIVGNQAVAMPKNAAPVASAIEGLGVPVYLSGMARGLLGRAHPLALRHRRREALREADCIVLAGVPCDFRLDYGRQMRRSSTVIAANRSRSEAYLNRKPTIAAIGDPGDFLVRLSERLQPGPWSPWIERLHERERSREAEIDREGSVANELVNPISLLRLIDATAEDDAVFVADGGDFVATASYIVHARAPLGWLDPGPFGTLGVGAGFALGAALCRPEAEVWIFYGDGACGYGLSEFDTFVRHGIAPIAVVGNDACWSQIAREQVKLLRDDVGTTLARTAYHEVAAGFGAAGLLARNYDEVPSALDAAKAAAKQGRPVLLNVWLASSSFREGSISM
jgi:thiamine pyrophosphate-dependent acetolactate synthase large subunit-like protein